MFRARVRLRVTDRVRFRVRVRATLIWEASSSLPSASRILRCIGDKTHISSEEDDSAAGPDEGYGSMTVPGLY